MGGWGLGFGIWGFEMVDIRGAGSLTHRDLNPATWVNKNSDYEKTRIFKDLRGRDGAGGFAFGFQRRRG